MENADLDLILGGIVTGRVTDSEGMPIVGEYVDLTMLDKLGPPDEILCLVGEEYDFQTDDSGSYRLFGIPPGQYLVSIGVDVAKVTGVKRDRYSFPASAQVNGDHYFEQTFSPGVRNRSEARVIEISAGTELRDVNLEAGKAVRAYAIRGRVIDAKTRDPITNCYIQLGHKNANGGYGSRYLVDGPSDTDHEGNFRLEGLLPGLFFVSAQFKGETDLYCEPVEFEVRDTAIKGLEIRALRGITLSGNVVAIGPNRDQVSAKLAQLKLSMRSVVNDIGGQDSREGAVQADGSFVVRGLRPGPVSVSLGYEAESKYFSMVRIEYPGPDGMTQAIPAFALRHPCDAAPLLLGQTGLNDVRIVLSYKNGSIRGRVNITRGSLDSNTRLRAYILSRTEKSNWSTSTEIDVNSNFFIDGLESGAYALRIVGELGILSEMKNVIVDKDAETGVQFMIDLTTTRESD